MRRIQVCQRACKLAIRADIAMHEEIEAGTDGIVNEIHTDTSETDGYLGRAHFKEAMLTARKSVSKSELSKYLTFKKELSSNELLTPDALPDDEKIINQRSQSAGDSEPENVSDANGLAEYQDEDGDADYYD